MTPGNLKHDTRAIPLTHKAATDTAVMTETATPKLSAALTAFLRSLDDDLGDDNKRGATYLSESERSGPDGATLARPPILA